MEEKKYLVYCHTFPNGKKYVGITSHKDPNIRWGYQGNGYQSQLVYKAIQKYGWDNIKHEVINENLSKQQALDIEVDLIKNLKLTDSAYGYNIDNGGTCGEVHSKTTRAKISKNNARKRKVICLTTNKVYDTITDAHKETGVSRCMISNVCAKRKKRIKGYSFLYLDEYENMSEDDLKAHTKWLNEISFKNQNFICLETRERFKMFKDASIKYGINGQLISDCCSHYKNRKRAGGYHWVFYEEYLKLSEEEIKQIIHDGKIICLETGIIYNGFTECSKLTGKGTHEIQNICKNYGRDTMKKHDYHFMYYLDYLNIFEYNKIEENRTQF